MGHGWRSWSFRGSTRCRALAEKPSASSNLPLFLLSKSSYSLRAHAIPEWVEGCLQDLLAMCTEDFTANHYALLGGDMVRFLAITSQHMRMAHLAVVLNTPPIMHNGTCDGRCALPGCEWSSWYRQCASGLVIKTAGHTFKDAYEVVRDLEAKTPAGVRELCYKDTLFYLKHSGCLWTQEYEAQSEAITEQKAKLNILDPYDVTPVV